MEEREKGREGKIAGRKAGSLAGRKEEKKRAIYEIINIFKIKEFLNRRYV